MSDCHNGRINRHHFKPTGRNPGALPPWDRLDPPTMRLDRNSATDADFYAGLEVWRPRRWYRVEVNGKPVPRPISSWWLPFAVGHLKRAGHTGKARRCGAPERPVDVVHLRNGHKGRCGEYGTMAATVGAATCPRCVVGGRPAEVAR